MLLPVYDFRCKESTGTTLQPSKQRSVLFRPHLRHPRLAATRLGSPTHRDQKPSISRCKQFAENANLDDKQKQAASVRYQGVVHGGHAAEVEGSLKFPQKGAHRLGQAQQFAMGLATDLA